MNYQLNKDQQYKKSASIWKTIKRFIPLLSGERKRFLISLIALLINSSLNLLIPLLIGKTIDNYIRTKQYPGLVHNSLILLSMYVGTLIATFVQTKNMGRVGQHLLYNLRNAIFKKIQELPMAFFGQNKTGDLISRINNDTDNLNQFFSQALVQFVANIFLMTGAAIFIISLDWRLGLFALVPALGILIFTRVISPLVRKRNTKSLQSIGGMGAEISESLDNFKVVVAFNREDYFRKRFEEVNEKNFKNALGAGFLNNMFAPVYTFGSYSAQIIVLFYGIYLISIGNLTVGLLISYLNYLTQFYNPIRQIAQLWASFQAALGSWDRISEILNLKSDLEINDGKNVKEISESVLTFDKVDFHYDEGKDILKKISFDLKAGKTYAMVGPTGGGKTTTASLMARLFDPKSGKVLLNGEDIRCYNQKELSQKIGFILQDPYLFTGTVAENIIYGNEKIKNYSEEELKDLLKKENLDKLLKRFDQGLTTKISSSGESISLGQRQIIAFIRAVLRKPKLLILDEATANIDTVTEKQLDEILEKLPKETTKVVIAHRLNTIADADEIFFVNAGEVIPAGSLNDALEMLMNNKRES